LTIVLIAAAPEDSSPIRPAARRRDFCLLIFLSICGLPHWVRGHMGLESGVTAHPFRMHRGLLTDGCSAGGLRERALHVIAHPLTVDICGRIEDLHLPLPPPS
jgi:hypothetical protein